MVEDGHRRAILYGRGKALVGALGLNYPAFVARHRKAISAGIDWRPDKMVWAEFLSSV